MPSRTAVAVYARISQDRDGARLGVSRQLDDCRAEAARRGWTVAEEYVDDDVSAYSGKTRPAYERMLADIEDGSRDAVIVWHMDRLHRRPIELEHFADVCTRARLTDVKTLHGDMNLGTGDGLLLARLLAAVAANESDAKSRRGKRKMLELAEAGRPHLGGDSRPFGFQADRVTHEPAEAQAIRDLAARVLAGESLASVARWLAASDIRTVHGNVWYTNTLRGLLLSPRIYGVRTHQGKPLGKGAWEPIISPDDGDRLRVLLTDPARRTNRTARRYALSGLCRCARCGTVMYSVPRYDTRRYLCRSGHDFGGCGKMAVAAVPLEKLVTDAVLYRLDTPELAQALAGTASDDTDTARLHEAISADLAKLEELAQMWSANEITAVEWRTARQGVEQRLTGNRKTLSRLRGTSVLDNLVGNGADLRARWETLNLTRQVAIIKALVDHVVIHSSTTPGIRHLDPARVQPIWKQ